MSFRCSDMAGSSQIDSTVEPRPILVVAGILVKNDRILVCQRRHDDPYGLQWEFPGGKLEPNENPQQALRRELSEELSIDAEIGNQVFRLRHRYPDRFVEVAFFLVPAYRGIIRNRVFEAVVWALRSELDRFPFLDADRELVKRICEGEVVGAASR
ncbi:MAG TPA: (deoxy)nucleoside triphosphate pyrophosphohydrolase [Terriglobia bacterium]|nr:(deoxy)nucleoside triphosphate pyrophosphohydrolase [Terriglobia bacterium]